MLQPGLHNETQNGSLVGSWTISQQCHRQRLDKKLRSSLHNVTMLECIAWSLKREVHGIEAQWLELQRWRGQHAPIALQTKLSEGIPTLSAQRSYALPATDSRGAFRQSFFWMMQHDAAWRNSESIPHSYPTCWKKNNRVMSHYDFLWFSGTVSRQRSRPGHSSKLWKSWLSYKNYCYILLFDYKLIWWTFATFCHYPTGAWADLPTDTKNLWSEQPKETTPAKQQFSSCGANSMSLVGTSRGQQRRVSQQWGRLGEILKTRRKPAKMKIISGNRRYPLSPICSFSASVRALESVSACASVLTEWERGRVLIVLYDWLMLIASCKYYKTLTVPQAARTSALATAKKSRLQSMKRCLPSCDQ